DLGLEVLLDRAWRTLEHEVHEFGFARWPRRLIADEKADHPGVVAPRPELLGRLALDLLREGRRIHVRHAHDGPGDALPAAQWIDIGLAQRWRLAQRVVELGAIGGVQAPGVHAPRGQLRGCRAPALAKALLDIRDVEGHRVAQRIDVGSWRGNLRMSRDA